MHACSDIKKHSPVPDARARALLLKWISPPQSETAEESQKRPGMLEGDVQILRDRLINCGAQSIWKYVSHIGRKTTTGKWLQYCPEKHRSFIKSFAHHYPTSSFVDPVYAAGDLCDLLEDKNITLECKSHLAEFFPALSALVSKFSWTQLPCYIIDMLKYLRERALYMGSMPEV